MNEKQMNQLHSKIVSMMKSDIPGLMKMMDPAKVGGDEAMKNTEHELKKFMALKPE